MKSRVTERGQITIPKSLRERLGIQAGQVMEFTEEEGRIVLQRQVREHTVDQLFGILAMGQGTDALMGQLRGPVPSLPQDEAEEAASPTPDDGRQGLPAGGEE